MVRINYSFTSADIKAITKVFEALSQFPLFENEEEANKFFSRIENAGVHLLSHASLTDDDISVIASSVSISCDALRYKIEMPSKLIRYFEPYSKTLKKLESVFQPVVDSIDRNMKD